MHAGHTSNLVEEEPSFLDTEKGKDYRVWVSADEVFFIFSAAR